MDSNDLKAVMKKLEDKGISLSDAAGQLKIKPELLRLYAVGGLVPDRIIKNLDKLSETGLPA